LKSEVVAIKNACEAVLGFFYADEAPEATEAPGVGAIFESEDPRVVVLGVEGSWRGCLVLMFPYDQLAGLTNRFMGMDMGDGWSDYGDDVMLELGNQIAARACREIEELGLGRTDLTPPSLIKGVGTLRMGWNLREASVLSLGGILRIAVGLAPGPKRTALEDDD
jgi:CheY-specific phosphatase CheX